jgi:subtilisin family serine protease
MPLLNRRVAPIALAVIGLLVGPAVLLPSAAQADQIRDRQYWLSEYGIERAWQVTKGAGIRIAIIDTGVDGSHQDLRGAVVAGSDFSGLGDDDGQTPVGQDRRHGTMVGSLAAGRGNNSIDGVIGSAPEAEILSLSMSFGGGTIPPDDQIARAVRYAVDNGADIISLSLTRNTRDWPESWDSAFSYAAENDVVVIAAAGNRGSGTEAVGAPATMPGVLTVGGVNREGKVSATASAQGITLGVMAPSEGLVGAIPGGGYVAWSGTSGATPIVAGIVALVRAAHPELDAANVIHRILSTATSVTQETPDPLYGFGIVNAYEAVTAEVALVSKNPLGSLDEWIVIHRKQEGSQIVIPLGPQQTTTEAEGPRNPNVSLQPDTEMTILPYVITGVLAAALISVLVGFVVVSVASRKPID